MNESVFSLQPCTGGLGANIAGIDLSTPLDDATFAELHKVWIDHQVVFFRDQKLEPLEQLAFARRFGESIERLWFMGTHPDSDDVQVAETNPDREPELFIDWHTDVTWKEVPTLGTLLYCVETTVGVGDTMWTNMCTVYDAVSEPLQKFLEGLTGVHDPLKGREVGMLESMGFEAFKSAREAMPKVEHPLVTVHPETGRHILYTNPLFLSHIKELERDESDVLLNYLYRLSERPEFQCRLQWEVGTVALWDNRCTMHKVVNDFWPQKRTMHRIGIEGAARPCGV